MSSSQLQSLSRLASRYVAEGRVPGIVNLVMRNGKIVHFEAVGNRGIDNESPMQVDDLFRIYSMTKPITSVALMQLYEQGKFQLSDPVTTFIPELTGLNVLNEDGTLSRVEREMTMHQLLMHTAGFSYGFHPSRDAIDKLYVAADLVTAKDLEDFVSKLSKLPLRSQPGEIYHYSVAVDVIGLVVERLSELPLDEYIDTNILKPLQMYDTFFEIPLAKRERFVQNHFINPESGLLTDTDYAPAPYGYREGVALSDFFNVSLFSGGAGLVSTAMDYARFAEMLRRGGTLDGARILGPKSIAFMTRNHLSETSMHAAWEKIPTPDIGRPGFGFGLGFGDRDIKSGHQGGQGQLGAEWCGQCGLRALGCGGSDPSAER